MIFSKIIVTLPMNKIEF